MDEFATLELKKCAPWFLHRMSEDVWQFVLMLNNGTKVAISRISDIVQDEDGVKWLEVELLESDEVDIPEILTAPTTRTTATIRLDAVVIAYEIADT